MRQLFFILAFAGSIAANAQLAIGPELGLNFSTVSGGTDDFTLRTSSRLGFNTDVKLTGNLYLQPGLFYSGKGGHTVDESTQNLAALAGLAGLGDLLTALNLGSNATNLTVTNNISYTLNYLQLPVIAVYKFKAGNDGKLFVGVGPYAAMLMDGRYKRSSVSGIAGQSLTFNEDRAIVKGTDVTMFDFGLNGNIGYMHNSGFFCRGFYEMGLVDNNLGKNLSFGLSIGYFFSSDKQAE